MKILNTENQFKSNAKFTVQEFAEEYDQMMKDISGFMPGDFQISESDWKELDPIEKLIHQAKENKNMFEMRNQIEKYKETARSIFGIL